MESVRFIDGGNISVSRVDEILNKGRREDFEQLIQGLMAHPNGAAASCIERIHGSANFENPEFDGRDCLLAAHFLILAMRRFAPHCSGKA